MILETLFQQMIVLAVKNLLNLSRLNLSCCNLNTLPVFFSTWCLVNRALNPLCSCLLSTGNCDDGVPEPSQLCGPPLEFLWFVCVFLENGSAEIV